MEICSLIPVYNEARHIEKVVKGCLKHVNAAYVVDDGSRDGSAQVARNAGAIVLRHPTNRGKGAALKTGFAAIMREGRWDGVVVLDGDEQHDWDEIPMFISYMREGGYDIVVGSRMGDLRPMPLCRKATNILTSRTLSALTGQRIEDSQCGFRLIKTDTLRGLYLKTTKFDTESEILFEAGRRGFTIGNLPIRTIYGPQRSYIHPILDTFRFFRMAARFTIRVISKPEKSLSWRVKRDVDAGCRKERIRPQEKSDGPPPDSG